MSTITELKPSKQPKQDGSTLTDLIDLVVAQERAIGDDTELADSLSEFAELTLRIEVNAAQRDLEIQRLKEKFAEAEETLTLKRDSIRQAVSAYSDSHRERLYGDRQSITVRGHELYYRRSPGRVEQLPGVKAKDSVARLLSLLATVKEPERRAQIAELIRIKPDLDKNNIIKRHEAERDLDILSQIGVTIVKDEEFDIKIDRQPTSR